MCIYIYTGWWFGTLIVFSIHIGNVIIPTDELICFRGVGQNHQPDYYYYTTIINHIVTIIINHYYQYITNQW